ncbi:Hypothetical protein CINCED_3A018323 [Cinara cedri]|uniref:Uncharacterized protein n=1 Tax=Cinara cedri TaxID=506608 RepID=A0A5E4NPF3_9HEMI|nr:Hypothetical protein CINCED_3A018323 [Cinara cedri]
MQRPTVGRHHRRAATTAAPGSGGKRVQYFTTRVLARTTNTVVETGLPGRRGCRIQVVSRPSTDVRAAGTRVSAVARPSGAPVSAAKDTGGEGHGGGEGGGGGGRDDSALRNMGPWCSPRIRNTWIAQPERLGFTVHRVYYSDCNYYGNTFAERVRCIATGWRGRGVPRNNVIAARDGPVRIFNGQQRFRRETFDAGTPLLRRIFVIVLGNGRFLKIKRQSNSAIFTVETDSKSTR